MAKITIQRTPDAPFEEVDEGELVKTTGTDTSGAMWVEYRLSDEHSRLGNKAPVVHRSATAQVSGVESVSDVGGLR